MTTKKDEKDADRPHYYSQFWLDVAAGRRVIGAPKSEDGADLADADLPEPTPLARRGGRVNANILPVDGYRETRAPAAVADEVYDEDDEFTEPEDEEPDLLTEVDDEDIPTILDDTPQVLTPDIEPEVLDEAEEEPDEDEEFFDDEEEEEEEDEDGWSARGRKKPKPGRQVKAPKPPVKKPPRRGRGF
jgi:hypothetical protein